MHSWSHVTGWWATCGDGQLKILPTKRPATARACWKYAWGAEPLRSRCQGRRSNGATAGLVSLLSRGRDTACRTKPTAAAQEESLSLCRRTDSEHPRATEVDGRPMKSREADSQPPSSPPDPAGKWGHVTVALPKQHLRLEQALATWARTPFLHAGQSMDGLHNVKPQVCAITPKQFVSESVTWRWCMDELLHSWKEACNEIRSMKNWDKKKPQSPQSSQEVWSQLK